MDANDIKKTETIRFREYIVQGDNFYRQNDIDSAIISYFSALKIDKTHYSVLLKVYIIFSLAKVSNANKKVMREICLFFLEQKNSHYVL